MILESQDIPFDISGNRTIKFDVSIKKGLNARNELEKQIRSIEEGNTDCENPIATAIDLQSLVKSGKSKDAVQAELLSTLVDIKSEIKQLKMEYQKLKLQTYYTDPASPWIYPTLEERVSIGEPVLIKRESILQDSNIKKRREYDYERIINSRREKSKK